MSSNNSDCPYHSKRWRSLVQQTINCLRQDKLMEGRHCRTFPRLVCTCPGKILFIENCCIFIIVVDKVSSTFKAPQVSKESIDVWYEQVSCQSTAIGQSLKEIISALYVAAKSTENNLLLVINIIYLVYHGEYSHILVRPDYSYIYIRDGEILHFTQNLNFQFYILQKKLLNNTNSNQKYWIRQY